MRAGGNSKPLLRMAERTRSFASFTAASGKPTTSNDGTEVETSHSTVTKNPSIPFMPRLCILDSIVFSLFIFSLLKKR